jgi:hypothetical protein
VMRHKNHVIATGACLSCGPFFHQTSARVSAAQLADSTKRILRTRVRKFCFIGQVEPQWRH